MSIIQTTDPLLKISDLRKIFPDGTIALDGVSFDVSHGEFVMILGPSGSGKTSLLRCINGLVEPTSGDIILDDVPVTKKNLRSVRKKVGLIFQHFNLVGNLSSLNNVLTGLLDYNNTVASLFLIFKKELKLRALECLDMVGLVEKAHVRADQLSGGQQQRVGIARAIARNPILILADEPVASLDPMIAYNVLSLLKRICTSKNITVICNIHQVDLALKFADRIIGLSSGVIVMDELIENVTVQLIETVYKGHDQGMFFGPAAAKPPSDDSMKMAV
jgi:phosphonate transport system ATP-binding protein